MRGLNQHLLGQSSPSRRSSPCLLRVEIVQTLNRVLKEYKVQSLALLLESLVPSSHEIPSRKSRKKSIFDERTKGEIKKEKRLLRLGEDFGQYLPMRTQSKQFYAQRTVQSMEFRLLERRV